MEQTPRSTTPPSQMATTTSRLPRTPVPTTGITVNQFHVYSGDGITILGNGNSTNAPISHLLIENVAMTGDLLSVVDTTVNGVPQSALMAAPYHLQSYTQALPNATRNLHGINIKPTPSNNSKPNPSKTGASITDGSYQLFFEAAPPHFISEFTLDNVVFDENSLSKITATGNKITTETNVYPAALNELTGSNSYASMTSTTSEHLAQACHRLAFVTGDLFAATGNSTSLRSLTITEGGSITLNAVVQPIMSQVTHLSQTFTARHLDCWRSALRRLQTQSDSTKTQRWSVPQAFRPMEHWPAWS